jgi:hypothetical protein
MSAATGRVVRGPHMRSARPRQPSATARVAADIRAEDGYRSALAIRRSLLRMITVSIVTLHDGRPLTR